MSKVIIFDLDDTLYSERTFVDSGFHAVAVHLEAMFGWDVEKSFIQMTAILEKDGRGAVFNELLKARGLYSKKNVNKCISIYRKHIPQIKLSESAERILKLLCDPLYLVTDGNKLVQRNKVEALNIKKIFTKIYITHEYGLKSAKPSIYCFDLIRKHAKCEWEDMVYIGDNPSKDFLNLKPLGVRTIRLNVGGYEIIVPKPINEAEYIINSLDELVHLF